MSNEITYDGSKMIINMNSDVGDHIVISILSSSVDLIIESIADDLKDMYRSKQIEMFRVDNIRHNIRNLEANIVNLEYYGKPVDPTVVLQRILQQSGVFNA